MDDGCQPQEYIDRLLQQAIELQTENETLRAKVVDVVAGRIVDGFIPMEVKK